MCAGRIIPTLFAFIVIKGARCASVVAPAGGDACERGAPFLAHHTQEGTIGPTALFSWLGLLKVYLHDLDSVSVAVTGLVLVREHFAIASAEDVVKIPDNIFRESSEAMFFPRDDQVQYRSLRGYLTPPGPHALSTIALLHLQPADQPIPIRPVCQPTVQLGASNDLYILGFTDDNGPLEKFLYKMEFIEPEKCKRFYEFVELTDDKLVPVDTKCAAASNLNHSCVWDTGTALVTNVTGTWALLGVGVGGPGCAAAARFISLAHYWPWIQENAKPQVMDALARKRVGEVGRRHGAAGSSRRLAHRRDNDLLVQFTGPHVDNVTTPPPPEVVDVPLQEVGAEPGVHHFSHSYQLPPPEDMFYVNRSSALEINVQRGAGRAAGECDDKALELVYKDFINVTADETNTGSIKYKISLYDLLFLNFTCVTVKAYPEPPEQAYLQYTIGMHDGGDIVHFTPEQLLKYTPLEEPYGYEPKDPHGKMNKLVISAPVDDDSVTSMALVVWVEFARSAELEVRVYGRPTPAAYQLMQLPTLHAKQFTTPKTFIINPKDYVPNNNKNDTTKNETIANPTD